MTPPKPTPSARNSDGTPSAKVTSARPTSGIYPLPDRPSDRRDLRAHIRAAYRYELPKEAIAQEPARPPESARLLVLTRAGDVIAHARMRDLSDFLPARSTVVFNDTRVVPARFWGRRASGGVVEFLLLEAPIDERARAIVRATGTLQANEAIAITFPDGRPVQDDPSTEWGGGSVVLHRSLDGATWELQIPGNWLSDARLAEVGVPPLPPYIARARDDARLGVSGQDRVDYQTTYAAQGWAVAAPTAGLHFTPELLGTLDADGHERVTVTLDVGPGTFLPVRVDDISRHTMQAERYRVTRESLDRLRESRALARPIVAIGTTTVRTLETIAQIGWLAGTVAVHDELGDPLRVDSGTHPAIPILPREGLVGETTLFLHPPYRFQAVDGLLTNFHLPESTLLMLVAAFVDRRVIIERYREAVAIGYRFYSYGDAMLILPEEKG